MSLGIFEGNFIRCEDGIDQGNTAVAVVLRKQLSCVFTSIFLQINCGKEIGV